MDPRLRLDGVSYAYRRGTPVLSDVSWSVGAERTVLLGPNGAGKSTVLSLLAGALRPKRGRLSFGSLEPRGDTRTRFLKSVGWMPQQIAPIAGLTCREQVGYVGWLKGLGKSDALDRASIVLGQVGLASHQGKRTSDLSGGQLRRIGLAQALVGAPSVLLLDEPTEGLDPAQRATFRGLISELPRGTIVLVSTHHVDDLADIFEDVAIMSDGAILWHGSVSAFVALALTGSVRPAESAYRTIVGEPE